MVRNFPPITVPGQMSKRDTGSPTNVSKVPEHVRKSDVPWRGSRYGSRGFRRSVIVGAPESECNARRWIELQCHRDTGPNVLQPVSPNLRYLGFGHSQFRNRFSLEYLNFGTFDERRIFRHYRQQHEVTDGQRVNYGLSTQFAPASSPFERLCFSLQSGLPNEETFALNVCTLLANGGRHTMQLNKAPPRLIELLIAQAGLASDG